MTLCQPVQPAPLAAKARRHGVAQVLQRPKAANRRLTSGLPILCWGPRLSERHVIHLIGAAITQRATIFFDPAWSNSMSSLSPSMPP